MSGQRDQEQVQRKKYQKMIDLLSENQQGRDFLERFVESQGFLGLELVSVDDITASFELLQKVEGVCEHFRDRYERSSKAMTQMSKTLNTTAQQLKGQNSIAGRVLKDIAHQLEDFVQAQNEEMVQIEETLQNLVEIEDRLGVILEDAKLPKRKPKNLSTGNKKSFI